MTIFILLCNSENVYAETMYVVDRIEVAVRSNKGMEHGIVAVVRTDEKVEVLSTEGEYAFIRCPNGVEGWMLKRYLTSSLPKSQEINRLKTTIEQLRKDKQEASDEISKLHEDRRILENNLRLKKEALKQVENELDELKRASAEYLTLRQEHELLREEMEKTMLKLEKLSEENMVLRSRSNFMWFVAGASAILFGFIMGSILQSLRYYKKRKSRY